MAANMSQLNSFDSLFRNHISECHPAAARPWLSPPLSKTHPTKILALLLEQVLVLDQVLTKISLKSWTKSERVEVGAG